MSKVLYPKPEQWVGNWRAWFAPDLNQPRLFVPVEMPRATVLRFPIERVRYEQVHL